MAIAMLDFGARSDHIWMICWLDLTKKLTFASNVAQWPPVVLQTLPHGPFYCKWCHNLPHEHQEDLNTFSHKLKYNQTYL